MVNFYMSLPATLESSGAVWSVGKAVKWKEVCCSEAVIKFVLLDLETLQHPLS